MNEIVELEFAENQRILGAVIQLAQFSELHRQYPEVDPGFETAV